MGFPFPSLSFLRNPAFSVKSPFGSFSLGPVILGPIFSLSRDPLSGERLDGLSLGPFSLFSVFLLFLSHSAHPQTLAWPGSVYCTCLFHFSLLSLDSPRCLWLFFLLLLQKKKKQKKNLSLNRALEWSCSHFLLWCKNSQWRGHKWAPFIGPSLLTKPSCCSGPPKVSIDHWFLLASATHHILLQILESSSSFPLSAMLLHCDSGHLLVSLAPGIFYSILCSLSDKSHCLLPLLKPSFQAFSLWSFFFLPQTQKILLKTCYLTANCLASVQFNEWPKVGTLDFQSLSYCNHFCCSTNKWSPNLLCLNFLFSSFPKFYNL